MSWVKPIGIVANLCGRETKVCGVLIEFLGPMMWGVLIVMLIRAEFFRVH